MLSRAAKILSTRELKLIYSSIILHISLTAYLFGEENVRLILLDRDQPTDNIIFNL